MTMTQDPDGTLAGWDSSRGTDVMGDPGWVTGGGDSTSPFNPYCSYDTDHRMPSDVLGFVRERNGSSQ